MPSSVPPMFADDHTSYGRPPSSGNPRDQARDDTCDVRDEAVRDKAPRPN